MLAMNHVLMSLQAARLFGVEVDTLTLSVEQKSLAEERVRAAGLQDRIRIHLMDYRDMPIEWAGRFDAFVSVEMLEVSTPSTPFPLLPNRPTRSVHFSTWGPNTTRPTLNSSTGP